MTVDIPDLIAITSSVYTLHPGDIILTGTPEGVGPVAPGDVIRAGREVPARVSSFIDPILDRRASTSRSSLCVVRWLF